MTPGEAEWEGPRRSDGGMVGCNFILAACLLVAVGSAGSIYEMWGPGVINKDGQDFSSFMIFCSLFPISVALAIAIKRRERYWWYYVVLLLCWVGLLVLTVNAPGVRYEG
jgi:hypothetical protein